MQNPNIFNRPMMNGMQPPPVNSDNMGITSGLGGGMAPPAAPQPAPEDMAAVQTGVGGIGEMFANLEQSLDSAENIEDLLNKMRGDNKPLQARFNELSELVGPEDAADTPESVLVVLQPTFSMMDDLKQKAPQGGINDLPMGGEETGNFSQAPGSQEAVMRMAAGEQPVFRQDGSSANGENDLTLVSQQDRSQLINDAYPFLYGTGTGMGYPTGPQLGGINLDTVLQSQQAYFDMLSPQFGAGGSGDPSAITAKNMGILKPYMVEPRTKEEILAEQRGFFGDDEQRDAEVQAGLGLAGLGAKIAQSPGSLLQAFTEGAPEFAEKLSKVAGSKAAAERAAKEFAYNTAESEKAQRRQTEFSVASAAITEAAQNARSAADARATATRLAAEFGLRFGEIEMKNLNDSAMAAWNLNGQHSLNGVKTYFKVIDGKPDYINVVSTAAGPRQQKTDGSIAALPDGYIELDANGVKLLGSQGKLDFTKAKDVKLLVPSSTSPSGYVPAMGVYDKEGTGQTYIRDTRKDKDGEFIYAGGYRLAPEGSLYGDLNTVFSISKKDDAGRITLTNLITGESKLASITSQFTKKLPNGDIVPVGEGEATVAFTPAHTIEPLVVEETADGDRRYISGNPMVQNMGTAGVPYADLSVKDANTVKRTIFAGVSALDNLNDLMGKVPDIAGPLNSVKQFSTNVLQAFVPFENGELVFAKTQAGRAQLQNFTRKFIAAAALSDRYATAEQALLAEILEGENSLFMTSPAAMMIRLQEIGRELTNDVARARATLGNTDAMRLSRVPTGNQNDPFVYGAPGHYDYLSMLASKHGVNTNAYKNLNIQIPNKVIARMQGEDGTGLTGSQLVKIGSLFD